MKTEAFNEIPEKAFTPAKDIYGVQTLDNIASMKIGAGDACFKADKSGIWLGANKFADAPFSVDLDGNITATTLSLSSYISKTGTSQQLTGDIRVGSGANIILDGSVPQITMSDGSNIRLHIGYQSGGY